MKQLSKCIKNILSLNVLNNLIGFPPQDEWLDDQILNQFEDVKLPHRMSRDYLMISFLIKDNKMNLSDKLKYLKYDSLTKRISIVNIDELIMENPVVSNWWTESIKKISETLWLPDNKISFGSDIDYVKECKSTMGNNTWFSVKSTRSISDQLEQTNPYLSTLNNNKSNVNGMMKIRLYPTQHQKKILQNMFDANRYSYNKVIEIIGDKMYDFTPGIFEAASKNARRYTTKKHMKELGVPESIINTNSAVLDSAYQDVLKARNSTIAASVAMKLKTGIGFKLDKLKYRSKKLSYSESIEIPTESIKSGKTVNNLYVEICPRSFKFKDKVKYKPCIRKTRRTRAQIKMDSEKRANDIKILKDYKNSASQIKIKIPLPKLNYSIRLQKIKPNIYYICVPVTKNIEPIKTNKICSIDPGVRTMLTVLDPEDKQVYMIGNNVDELIKRNKKIDKIKSKLRKFKGKRNARYRLKKEMRLIQHKIKNMTHDMHHKTSKFLANNFKTIIYPRLKVKSICNKKHRNIYKTTARQMYIWAHYKFRELLKYKTFLRGGKVVECTEEYTSKTCSCCGRLNHTLGASKTFKCPFCKHEVDRDVGAARNIYLKNCHLI